MSDKKSSKPSAPTTDSQKRTSLEVVARILANSANPHDSTVGNPDKSLYGNSDYKRGIH